jgi:hypothetical protein
MGYGVSHHARGVHPVRDIAAAGVTCAVLGTNPRWTTFAIVDDAGFDLERVAHELQSVVVQIATANDDCGRTLRFYAADGWQAEFNVLSGADGELSSEDRKLLSELVRRDVLTDAQGAALEAGISQEPAQRDLWMLTNGIEQAFDVPNATMLPWPCPADLLAEIVPGVEVVAPPKNGKRRAAKTARPPKPGPAVPPATVDRAVLALHVHYWTGIFQMNCWTLYNKYKKHLPAERRREVDALIDLLARSDWNPPRVEVEREVEAILATVWDAADWDTAVRDPGLLTYEGRTAEEVAAWERLLESTPKRR